MSANEKIYVIDPVPKGKLPGKSTVLYRPDDSASGDGQRDSGGRRSSEQSLARLDRLDERGSSALAFLAYFAGPLSILATRRGRRSKFWISAALLSCAAAAAVALRALGVIPGQAHGFGVGSLLWLAAGCIAALAGFTVWARGVFLIGRWRSPLIRRLPGWIRHPGAAAILGLAVPGLGLFVAGHPRRAASALWTVSLVVVAAVILGQAPALWQWNRSAGPFALRPGSLEIAFLAIAALGMLGALAWIVQALDGVRLAERRLGLSARPRGDLAALALLAAIIAFVAMFQPAQLAVALDRFGAAAHEEGFRIVPLHAATAAMKLDPSRPEYALHAIAINESLGRAESAEALRSDLAARWHAYAQSLRLASSWMRF